MITVIIDGQTVTIDDYFHLVLRLMRLSEPDQKRLMQAVLVHNDLFETFITELAEIKRLIILLKTEYMDLLMSRIWAEDNIFNYFVEDLYKLIEILNDFPAAYVIAVTDKISNDHKIFSRVMGNIWELECVIQRVPECYGKVLMEAFLNNNEMFTSYGHSTFQLSRFVSYLPEMYARKVIKKIFFDNEIFNHFICDAWDLKTALLQLPFCYGILILEKVMSQDISFIRIISKCSDLKDILKYVSPNYGSLLMDKVLKSFGVYIHILQEDPANLFGLINDLPEQYARQLIQGYSNFHAGSVLHVAIKQCPVMIPKLLALGADPTLEDIERRTALQLLRNQENYSRDDACALVEYGANPNDLNRHSYPFLHEVINERLSILPRLLECGADPSFRSPVGYNHLDSLMLKRDFTDQDKDTVLQLIRYGAFSDLITIKDQNILHIIYEKYPSIKQYVISKNVPEEQADNPDFVFKAIHFSYLRFEIKYQSATRQARTAFLNLCLMWVYRKNNEDGRRVFKNLPNEVFLQVLKFLNLEKNEEECRGLIEAVITQREVIKQMTGSPGGISVLQQTQDNKPVFTFFPSAETLCFEHDKLNKRKYAISYLKNHLSLFKKPGPKRVLINSIKDTPLYANINCKKFVKG